MEYVDGTDAARLMREADARSECESGRMQDAYQTGASRLRTLQTVTARYN